jgi:hypothetical protein
MVLYPRKFRGPYIMWAHYLNHQVGLLPQSLGGRLASIICEGLASVIFFPIIWWTFYMAAKILKSLNRVTLKIVWVKLQRLIARVHRIWLR